MKKIYLALAIVLCLSFGGCANGKTGYTKTVDREGKEITVPAAVNRIVSTAPSNTEILVGLGLADKIIAVDMFATDIAGLPKDVRAIDFQTPDIELLISMKPDIIIASELNRQGGSDPFSALRDAGITVLYLPTSRTIAGIYDDIAFLAEITGTKPQGEKLIGDMKAEVERVKNISNGIAHKKTVYFEIDSSPSLYSFGRDTFINELLETAGGINIFENETGWIAATPESIVALNPDVIISINVYTDDSVDQIKARTGFSSVTAVQNGDVYLITPNYVSRPTQNIVKGLIEIAQILYPEYYEK